VKLRKHRERSSSLGAVVGGVVLVGVVYLVVRSIPELIRYLRVRRM
jgi:hypothetical protein